MAARQSNFRNWPIRYPLAYICELYKLLSEMDGVKASAYAFASLVILLGCCFTPVMAQGVTVGFTVYVSFFYPFCYLYNLQVTLRDQSGRIIATGASPDGSMIIINIRTETSISSLTASVFGYASGPLTHYTANVSSWVVYGMSMLPVENTGGNYWVTLNLYS